MQTVKINQWDVSVKECNGQRVVTFKEIDQVHGRPTGTARRNFNENKEHFKLGKDYFVRNSYEAKTEYGITAPNGIVLITESGYLMLVKSFGDKLAWDIQRELVNTYFKKRGPVAPPAEQLTLEQAIAPAARMYQGQPVMTFRDLSNMSGLAKSTEHYNLGNKEYFTCGRDYLVLSGEELKQFKRDNPDISNHAGCLTVVYMPAVVKLCKKLGVKFNPAKFKQLPSSKTEVSKEEAVEADPEKSAKDKRMKAISNVRELASTICSLMDQLEFWDGAPDYDCPIRSTASILGFTLYCEISKTGSLSYRK